MRDAGYEWQPQTPDRLLSMRKEPAAFRPLVQFFGLGLQVMKEELLADGLGEGVWRALSEARLVRDMSNETEATVSPVPQFKAEIAVSGAGDLFIAHDHWPPDPHRAGGYVHYAAESAWLARQLGRDLEGFIDKRVLDLGCSSGGLAFEVCVVASEVLGLDISERSIAMARTCAQAYGFRNTRFEVAEVGEKSAEEAVGSSAPWDAVIMNPPMVVPAREGGQSHRDGGRLGIELPLKFLDFSYSHLREGGEVITFVTNPIVKGRPAFFDAFESDRWETIEKRCLHSHFNQTVARKQGYAEQGIERIELWFLHLKRR